MARVKDKIKLVVEIYQRIKETHEIIVDKKWYDKKGFSIFDYISEDSLIDIEDTSEYEILDETEEVEEAEDDANLYREHKGYKVAEDGTLIEVK